MFSFFGFLKQLVTSYYSADCFLSHPLLSIGDIAYQTFGLPSPDIGMSVKSLNSRPSGPISKHQSIPWPSM